MKKLLILFLLFSSSAFAEWTRIDDTSYIDVTTIKRTQNSVRMWDMIDFGKTITSQSSGVKYKSATQYIEYDCVDERWRIVSYLWHSGAMANGDIVLSARGDGNWEYVNPGSIIKRKFLLVCTK